MTINILLDSGIIKVASEGVQNYIDAETTENQVMQNVVDYLDSIVASIKGEDSSGGGSSGTGTDLSTLSETERLALVGQYVDYTPDSGTYSTITKSSTYTGTTSNTSDFTTDTSLNWQIWSIDDNTLTLIADDTSQSGGYDYTTMSKYGWCLCLISNLGYNNGVYLLNKICETLYSNTELGATARSLNIQDIEEVLDWDIWAPTDYYYSSTFYTYISTYQYTSSSGTYYPGLWSDEDYANIDGKTVNTASYIYDSNTGILTYTGSGLRRSEQTEPNTTSKKQASSYIEPTETYWFANASTLQSAWIDSKYASLVNCGRYYWLASRSVRLSTSKPFFGLQCVDADGIISAEDLYYYSSSYSNVKLGIRPMVEIPLASVSLEITNYTGDTADDAYQLVKN